MANELERIAGINTQIAVLDGQVDQVVAERSMLRHIDDDAQRDAAVSGSYDDRAEARRTGADVVRMDKQMARMERTRAKLVASRDRLIRKLTAS
jgi:hypothetical protein